jgi:hypothetical protein
MITDDSQLEYSPANMLTLDEAAQRIGVDTDEVDDLIRNGCLTSVVYDGQPCIHVSVLDLYTSGLIPIANALSSNAELNDVPR